MGLVDFFSGVFDRPDFADESPELKAIIRMHSTTVGPALSGTRIYT